MLGFSPRLVSLSSAERRNTLEQHQRVLRSGLRPLSRYRVPDGGNRVGPDSGGAKMTTLTLDQASTIVDKALERGRELNLQPLTVVVLDAGGQLKAMKREERSRDRKSTR